LRRFSQDDRNIISEFNVFGIPSKDTTEQKNIVIYPNPAKDFFFISFNEEIIFPNTVRIFDMSGKMVFENFYESGLINVQIPPNIASGIYLVNISSGSLTLYAQQIVVKR
jgi:hypothetical protein